MVFNRLFNSRSFRLAKRFSEFQGSTQQSQISKRFVRPIPRVTYHQDITSMQGIMWVVFGGIPFGIIGVYVVKVFKDAVEAGEVPSNSFTNDEWLAAKEALEEAEEQSEALEEGDEGTLLAAATEESKEASPVLEFLTPPPEEEEEEEIVPSSEVADCDSTLNLGKDTVIFVDPPSV